MTSHLTQEQITLRSRQLNPCDHLFWRSRGYAERPDNWEDILEEIGYYASDTEGSYHEEESEYEEEAEFEEESEYDEEEDSAEEEEDSEDEEYEEHMTISNENNPNNDAFWRLRGYSERPDNWRELIP
ncbi:uncharacterized protein isoform X2 [Leptinotarsa decemlineata]|uniref:uncharacterized protein isoform X2 n=1 Tax=Leptinotarsa decemlineata TaxID=7539 RepID=UPI000C255484|nr:acidic leucine-rich nuclear phosphoprotein 32-related protein 2-like [Leptinotarsa decemlineata]